MTPKHILFIEANLDGTVGGSHYCLLELIKYLDRKKFEPFVLFYQENSLIPEFEKVCPVILFDKTNRLNIKKNWPAFYNISMSIPIVKKFMSLSQKTYNFLRYSITEYFKNIYILSKYRVDLVHINNAPYLTDWLLASKIMRVECTAHLRGTWKVRPWYNRVLMRYYDAVIVISKFIYNDIISQDIPTYNFFVIHDGIDVNSASIIKRKTPDDIKIKFNIPFEANSLIGVVGNIKHWKGQHVLIEAMNLIIDKNINIKCLIIGDVSTLKDDQDYFKYLKDLINKYNLSDSVFFTGFTRDILEVMSALSILVHTSTDPEPLGRVILEGMILSKPVIATAHGGPLEIIEDGVSGFLVPPNDPKALADKIGYLISNRDIRERAGQIARKRVEEYFSIETNVIKIEQLYAKLLNS